LVDDFRDAVNLAYGDGILDLHRNRGVEVISRDLIADGFGVEGKFDVIATFDSMEHWHHSPKRLFHEAVKQLKPEGRLIIGVPNCVNLRKRLTMPFGYRKWSAFREWYEADLFRVHVREPDVEDLHSIAADLGLAVEKVFGRNWVGYTSSSHLVRLAVNIIDLPLQYFPSLCGNIYLVARKH
jgi:SAM-dependent methyltransferase